MKKKDKKGNGQSPLKVIRSVAFMMGLAIKHAPTYILVVLTEGIGRGIWHILGVLFIKYLFDSIEAGVDFGKVLIGILLYTLYNALFELFNKYRLEVYNPRVRLVLHEAIQSELYQKARTLDQSCYDDPEFYNDFVWAMNESDNRVVDVMEAMSLFINRVISSITIFTLLALMEWVVTVILVICLVVSYLLKLKMNKLRHEQSVEMNPIHRKLGYISRIFYQPDHAKELRQGDIAETLREQYEETNRIKISTLRKYFLKFMPLTLLNNFINYVMPNVGITGYLIIRYLLDSSLSLGSFGASINACNKLFWIIGDLGNYFTQFSEHSLYLEKVKEFLEYEPKIKGERTVVPEFESLTLNNVSFSYPFAKEGEMILKNVDFKISKGEKIAFVGYNGAGKTTLIKLLMRLYDTTEGEILYNGENIREYSPEHYRKHIGTVFQDYRIFAATLAENVLGGEYTDGDEEKVLAALHAASFDSKLEGLENGIHTHLTREFRNDGEGLSGGEAQKVAIARVFAGDHDIIIMDEPSSALDPIAEYQLNQSILEYTEDKTVIFISHRLSTTRMADRIYMFDSGRIIEEGSHDALMALGGKYAAMFRLQAKKYRSEV